MPTDRTSLTFRPGSRQVWIGCDDPGMGGGGQGGPGGQNPPSPPSGSGQNPPPGQGDNPPGGGSQKPPEVTFNADQQVVIQRLIDDAYGRAHAKAEKVFRDQLAERDTQVKNLSDEIAKLKQALSAGDNNNSQPADKGSKPGEKTFTEAQLQQALARRDAEWEAKLAPLQEQLKAEQEKTARMLANERKTAIVSAAAKAKAYDPEDIAILVANYVVHDDQGRIQVVNPETGNPLVSSKGTAMTVEEFVKDYIDRKPHLKQGANNGGAGGGSRYVPGGAFSGQLQSGPPKNWAEADKAAAAALAAGAVGRR